MLHVVLEHKNLLDGKLAVERNTQGDATIGTTDLGCSRQFRRRVKPFVGDGGRFSRHVQARRKNNFQAVQTVGGPPRINIPACKEAWKRR